MRVRTIKKKLGNGAAVNSIILTFVSVLTTILGIVVTKLLSVNFSLQDYGTYSQANLVITTITSLTILGLTDATNFFYNKSEDNRKKEYVSTIFTIQYTVGVICVLVVLLLRKQIAAYFKNDDLLSLIVIIAFTPIFQNLIRMYQNLFVSIGRAKVLAVRNLIVAFIRLLVVVCACYYLNDIKTVLYSVLAMDIAQTAYFALSFKKEQYFLLPSNAKISLVKDILKYSIPMSVFILTNTLSRDIDKYVVSAFADTEILAVYTNASKVLPFDLLSTSMVTVLIPVITRYISGRKFNDAKNVFKLYLRISYILTSILVGGAIANSKNLMLFLYDEKYLTGLSVFRIYLAIDLIRFANITMILSSAGKTKILMYVSLGVLAANSILNIIAFKILGIIGPALTTLLLTIGMIVLLLHYGSKEIHTHIKELFDFKEIFLIGVQILIVGVSSYYLSYILDRKGVASSVGLIICYGLYLAILLLLNFKRLYVCFKKLNAYK